MTSSNPQIRAGMVGVGMIFDETYWPFFRQVYKQPLYQQSTGPVAVDLVSLASRTGHRAQKYASLTGAKNLSGDSALQQMLSDDLDVVCVATPDDRHFAAAQLALQHGKHVLIEKPSVLDLAQLDVLCRLAQQNGVLCRVVYHKLADPDHKKLRTHVVQGVLRHVNNGYCSLLEPKSISGSQFSEWITGRNPGTYVAVHYIKLIDFTFATPLPWSLARITATGQRGLVGPADGSTWDSVQMQMVYRYTDGREAAFDLHTSWVTPDNFPGYVEQEVQFRFDNGIWNAHQRKRGVELTVEDRSPSEFKYTPNHHYNGTFIEPWNVESQRGYGIEIIQRFFEEVAFVEYGGPSEHRADRLNQIRSLTYADASADRNTVAVVQALEAILDRHAHCVPGCVVHVNDPAGGLVLYTPGKAEPLVLYAGQV